MGKDEAIWDYFFRDLMYRVKPEDRWPLVWENRRSVGPQWGQYRQQAFGSFYCSRCTHCWASAQVLILFQMKLEKMRRRGTVKMNILKQKCKSCSAGIFEEPEFTEDNIRVILNNLMLSILELCYGEYVDDDELQSITVYGNLRGPHQSEHCSACQRGICDLTPRGNKSSRRSSSTLNASKAYQCQYPRESAPPISATIPEPWTDLIENRPFYAVLNSKDNLRTILSVSFDEWNEMNDFPPTDQTLAIRLPLPRRPNPPGSADPTAEDPFFLTWWPKPGTTFPCTSGMPDPPGNSEKDSRHGCSN
ncbi:receptor-transporting protein 3-like [Pleurodeles waltl]|uniref:receptor-transporting protein 3-like n=1 Tax=Pleurodeles waltl TaxID=8319 RepID=UPI003709BB04